MTINPIRRQDAEAIRSMSAHTDEEVLNWNAAAMLAISTLRETLVGCMKSLPSGLAWVARLHLVYFKSKVINGTAGTSSTLIN